MQLAEQHVQYKDNKQKNLKKIKMKIIGKHKILQDI